MGLPVGFLLRDPEGTEVVGAADGVAVDAADGSAVGSPGTGVGAVVLGGSDGLAEGPLLVGSTVRQAPPPGPRTASAYSPESAVL